MVKRLIIISICIILLTGCWDRKELSEIGIILAMALDRDESTGQIIVTSEAVIPAALKKEGGSAGENTIIQTSKGDTIFDAIRNSTKDFDRQSFFSHTKVIIISEKLAKEGISSYMDFFARAREIRRSAYVLIARNTAASAILSETHGIEQIQAQYLMGIIKSSALNSEVDNSDLLSIIKSISGEGINPVAGVAEIGMETNYPSEKHVKNTGKAIILTGTAVFQKDKLVGYLDYDKSKAQNILINKFKSGVMTIPGLEDKNKKQAIDIKRINSSIEPELKDGKISYLIKIKGEGDIIEQGDTTDTSIVDLFNKLQQDMNDTVKKNIEDLISHVQKEYKTDIFGFGVALNKKYPEIWEKVKDSWNDKIFPNIKYQVDSEIKIRRTGQINQPLSIEPAPIEEKY